jgi:hypothetical protein
MKTDTQQNAPQTLEAEMEAFKRYRTGGEQKVTVKHVTVNEGGKAIVGNVTQGQGGWVPQRNPRRPHERNLSFSAKPTMLGDIKKNWKTVPSPRCQGLDGLPIPRRAWRRSERQTQGMYRHGLFMKEGVAERRIIQELLRQGHRTP